MSTSMWALTGYVGWTLLLLLVIAGIRVIATLRGRAANDFKPSGDDVSPFSNRVCRAHANCYENLPVVATLILVAAQLGHPEITDGLALWLLGARIVQSAIHLTSTSPMAVSARFAVFVPQVAISAWWAVGLARLGL